MDTASGALGSSGTSTPPATGELIVQSGRLKGARRTLGTPLTFLGKSAVCDVRLNVDGISPLHCLIVHTEGVFQLRDLESESGTYLNGERVTSCQLRDGDLLAVGPFLFRLHLPKPPGPKPDLTQLFSTGPRESREREALRIQVAAVVAQQAALMEQEGRLTQRSEQLQKQERQLAAHLEEKRRRLIELHNQVQAARQNLQRDKQAYEEHLGRVTGDLSTVERELLEKQQQVEAERKRLLELRTKLKHRFHRHWFAERERMQQREQEMAEILRQVQRERQQMEQERERLAQACLAFNGDIEVGRRQLQEEWNRLRQAEKAARQKRQQERAAHRKALAELEQRETELAEAQAALQAEMQHWHNRVGDLQHEAEGLENRIRNQRRKLFDQQQEIQHLETVLRDFQQRLEQRDAPQPGSEVTPGDVNRDGLPVGPAAPRASDVNYPLVTTSQPTALTIAGPETIAAEFQVVTAPSKAEHSLQQRLTELEQLAGDLADQRLQLAEQWERLARTQQAWQQVRDVTAAEMTTLTARMQQQAQLLLQREQELETGIAQLQKRQEELNQLRQQLVAWQARLKAREVAWESERDQLLADVRSREELAERHLSALVELKQRWSRRRRQEVEMLRAERAACEKARADFLALSEDRRTRMRALEEERRLLTGKALALEQYRQECLTRSSDAAAAERRIDRLRRRWFNEQAEVLRSAQREKEELRSELQRLQERHTELQRHIDTLCEEKLQLAERQTEWEQRLIESDAEQARLRQDVLSLQAEKAQAEQLITDLRNEIERIARSLLEEPEPPTILRLPAPPEDGSLEKAA